MSEVTGALALSEPLLVVVGPTASKKTALAVRLAERCDGEIVSADSVQVYEHFDIGSGKPDERELARAPHHLIDYRSPEQPLDASEWADHADLAIAEITSRGKRPIVCGGTFLWIRALLWGLAEAPPADPKLREQHQTFADEHGRAALHERLAALDPPLARKLHPNDLIRVSRGLEVFELTGERLSDIQSRHGFRCQRYPARLVGLNWPRQSHDQLVAQRVQGMLDAGWVDETRALLEAGFGDTRAMDAVGYRQIRQALQADTPLQGAELAIDIVRVTRIFARRQRTWLREQPVQWLDPSVLDGSAEAQATLSLLLAPASEA